MPKYLFAASLTQSGVQGVMKEGGTSRREALQKTAESVGGRLEAFYFAFGETDVYLIVDVPDAAAAAALSMSTSASGAVHVKTTVLITPEEMDEARSKTVAYRPPGG
ncbi:MAG: GYD domain-containing protein [Actinomycetota bacterium]